MITTVIAEDQLWELVESIWGAMLGLPVLRNPHDGLTQGERASIARIDIRGAFCGSVIFLTTEQFARRAAATMLALSECSVAPDDTEDTIVELCNILGGGIKGLLPGPSSLTLPSLILNGSPAARLLHAPVIASLCFTCDEQPLEVRVIEARGDLESTAFGA
jgi:chemotaxis protein CheX